MVYDFEVEINCSETDLDSNLTLGLLKTRKRRTAIISLGIPGMQTVEVKVVAGWTYYYTNKNNYYKLEISYIESDFLGFNVYEAEKFEFEQFHGLTGTGSQSRGTQNSLSAGFNRLMRFLGG